MEHFSKASLKTATNTRARATLNLKVCAAIFTAVKVRAIFAAPVLVAALSANAAVSTSDIAGQTPQANRGEASGQICLKKTRYTAQNSAISAYEYEVSQSYDAASGRLVKIHDTKSEDDRLRTKNVSKFDAAGEREIENAEYEWNFKAKKWRKTGLSKQERTRDGALVYTDLYGENGKLNNGQKTVEKIVGNMEISTNFTLKNGKWTPTYKTKRLFSEDARTTLVATYKWNAAARDWTPKEMSKFHYKKDIYAGYEGFIWSGEWIPQTRSTVFASMDGGGVEFNFDWKDGSWRRDKKIVRKSDPASRRFTELIYSWDAEKSEWRRYYENVREETERGWAKSETAALWQEGSQGWERVFESELSYNERGNVVKRREASEGKRYEYIYDYDEAGNNVSISLRESDGSGEWRETQRTQNVFEPSIRSDDVLDRGFIGDYAGADANAIKSSKQYFLENGEFKLNETREWFYGKCE